MLMPVGKRILIKPIELVQSKIIYANALPVQYTVIAIGDDVTKVKPGNVIYLEKHFGIEIVHENDKYLVIDESSILAKLD